MTLRSNHWTGRLRLFWKRLGQRIPDNSKLSKLRAKLRENRENLTETDWEFWGEDNQNFTGKLNENEVWLLREALRFAKDHTAHSVAASLNNNSREIAAEKTRIHHVLSVLEARLVEKFPDFDKRMVHIEDQYKKGELIPQNYITFGYTDAPYSVRGGSQSRDRLIIIAALSVLIEDGMEILPAAERIIAKLRKHERLKLIYRDLKPTTIKTWFNRYPSDSVDDAFVEIAKQYLNRIYKGFWDSAPNRPSSASREIAFFEALCSKLDINDGRAEIQQQARSQFDKFQNPNE